MRDDDVLRALAARVASGDYDDYVAIRPGSLDPGGIWVCEPDNGTRWYEPRGSEDHLAAAAAGAADPAPPLLPAPAAAVADAEAALGHPLPPLLRRL